MNAVKNTTAGWQIYRTRFLVKAKPLVQPMSFVYALGREQHGRPGDYLIESSDGSRSIQRREIFEDIYVAMGPAEASPSACQRDVSSPDLSRRHVSTGMSLI